MMFSKFTFLWLSLHGAAFGFGSLSIPQPPKGKIKVIALEPCEATDTPMILDAHLDTVSGDDKALSFTADLPVKLDNLINFTLIIDKWMDDEWFLDFYSLDGGVCDILKKWLPNMWSKFAKTVVPNLGDDCPHPAGNYRIENFEVNKDDATFPALLYGLFRANFRAFDENGNNFMCQILTADVSL